MNNIERLAQITNYKGIPSPDRTNRIIARACQHLEANQNQMSAYCARIEVLEKAILELKQTQECRYDIFSTAVRIGEAAGLEQHGETIAQFADRTLVHVENLARVAKENADAVRHFKTEIERNNNVFQKKNAFLIAVRSDFLKLRDILCIKTTEYMDYSSMRELIIGRVQELQVSEDSMVIETGEYDSLLTRVSQLSRILEVAKHHGLISRQKEFHIDDAVEKLIVVIKRNIPINQSIEDGKMDCNSYPSTVGVSKPRSSYDRLIVQRDTGVSMYVDPYDLLKGLNLQNPILDHVIKKAWAPGQRGHKDLIKDLQEIAWSAKEAVKVHQAEEMRVDTEKESSPFLVGMAAAAVAFNAEVIFEDEDYPEWVVWSGGECPVQPNTRIRVHYRSGQGQSRPIKRPQNYRWTHTGGYDDIVAYCIR